MATGLRKNNFFLWTRVKIVFLFTSVLAIFYGATYLQFKYSNILIELLVPVVLVASAYLLVELALQQIKDGLQSQKRFISSASHELRTPLSIIKANSEIVLMDKVSATKEDLLEVMESNMEEVDRMTEILTLLLHAEEQFTDTKRRTILVGEINLSQLVEDVLSKCVKFTNDKEIGVDFKLEPSIVVMGNKPKLAGVVYSVFHNAVTYTPNNGHVWVTLNQDENNKTAQLVIKDDGIGIPQEDLPHIFDPFYRTKHAENTGHLGVGGGHFGLGLTMAKKAVVDHNGSIVVKSPKNGGTEVIISIPASQK